MNSRHIKDNDTGISPVKCIVSDNVLLFFWIRAQVWYCWAKECVIIPLEDTLVKRLPKLIIQIRILSVTPFLSTISLLPTLGIFCLLILVILMVLPWHGIMVLIWTLWANGFIQGFIFVANMRPSAFMQSSLSSIAFTDLQNSKLLFTREFLFRCMCCKYLPPLCRMPFYTHNDIF